MKASVQSRDANGRDLGTTMIDVTWGLPIRVVLADLPEGTATVDVDPVTPNSMMAGGGR